MSSESSTSATQVVIEVCFGPECSDCGGREMAEELIDRGLNIIEGDCRDQCPNAPLVLVDNRMITDATSSKVLTRLDSLLQS